MLAFLQLCRHTNIVVFYVPYECAFILCHTAANMRKTAEVPCTNMGIGGRRGGMKQSFTCEPSGKFGTAMSDPALLACQAEGLIYTYNFLHPDLKSRS